MTLLGPRILVVLMVALALGGDCSAQEAGSLNATLAEGSQWSGMYKHRSNAGNESSGEVEIEITRRDGKDFEGQYRLNGGKGVVEFKGTINGTKVRFRFTKVIAWDGNDRNLVGLQFNGEIRRVAKSKKTVLAANYNWPSPDDVRVVRQGNLTLALQE